MQCRLCQPTFFLECKCKSFNKFKFSVCNKFFFHFSFCFFFTVVQLKEAKVFCTWYAFLVQSKHCCNLFFKISTHFMLFYISMNLLKMNFRCSHTGTIQKYVSYNTMTQPTTIDESLFSSARGKFMSFMVNCLSVKY